MLQICENIRQARVSRGLSQQELAEKLGVERPTYKNWEDKTEPSLSTIKSIAAQLEVPEATLLAGVIDLSPKEVGRANEEAKRIYLAEIAANLNRLTLSIGRLSGLGKEEIRAWFLSSLGKTVAEDLRKQRGKTDGSGKKGKGG